MSEDSDEPEVGLETVPPDGYLQPTRYRTTCRCRRCGHVYSWTSKSPPKHDKPCPRVECSEMAQLQATLRETQNLVKMLMEQRAPAHIGESNIVKAVDATAEIVMKDYGMTNLQDNIRHGEAVAPKLPPVQQQAADAYFGGGTAKDSAVLSAAGARRMALHKKQMARIGRQAMAGAFPTVNPSELMGGQRGSPILRSVGSEKIQ